MGFGFVKALHAFCAKSKCDLVIFSSEPKSSLISSREDSPKYLSVEIRLSLIFSVLLL